jgi:transcription termination factor NusB
MRRPRVSKAEAHAGERDGRRLALSALFEAEFGQHTAIDALEREIAAEGVSADGAALARQIVRAVIAERDLIDERIEELAPQYPVVQLARMDRALLRSGRAGSDVQRRTGAKTDQWRARASRRPGGSAWAGHAGLRK